MNAKILFCVCLSIYQINWYFLMNQPMIKELYHVGMDGILVDIVQESLHSLLEEKDLQSKVHYV